MYQGVDFCRRAICRHATGLLSACIACAAGAAWAAPAADRADDAERVTADIRGWSMDRPRACQAPAEPSLPPAGWRQAESVCAWRNLLQVRRWRSDAGEAGGCVSPQARWWAWYLAHYPVRNPAGNPARSAAVVPAAWMAAWPSQSVTQSEEQPRRVAVLQRLADGGWSATEWRWTPSEREATRTWQAGRWKILLDAAESLRQGRPAAALMPDVQALRAAWERNLNGRAGEIGPDTWRWQDDGLCLAMAGAGLSAPQTHMPRSADEGRLEQRSAMQLRLARRYPAALWLTPFRLAPRTPARPGAGAIYEAVWLDGGQVQGQLWIPRKKDGAIAHLRIALALPPEAGKRAREAAIARSAKAVGRELGGIAAAWSDGDE